MKLLFIVFIASLTLPFTQLLPLGSYNQPYALVFGTAILAFRVGSIWPVVPQVDKFAMVGLAVIGILIFVTTCFPYTDLQELKYLLNYVSPLILTLAVVATARADEVLLRRGISISVGLWFFVSLVQILVDPTFMTSLVGEWSEVAEDVVNSGRGVLGLAPEPTHHGFHMLILGGAAAMFARSGWLPWVCVAEAILLARSSSALLALMLAVGLLALLRRTGLVIVSACIVALVAVLFGMSENWLDRFPAVDDGSRIIRLAFAALQNPTDLLMLDYSVNMRIGGALASFMEIFDDYFMPHGMSHAVWLATGQSLVGRYDWLLDISTSGPPSGIGVVLFQAGFLAIPFFALCFRRILSIGQRGIGAVLAYSSVFVFLGQFSISSPDFSLLYGCAIYLSLSAWRSKATEFTYSVDYSPIETEIIAFGDNPQPCPRIDDVVK